MGCVVLAQIQTTLLLLTTNYCSVLVVYLRQPLLSPPGVSSDTCMAWHVHVCTDSPGHIFIVCYANVYTCMCSCAPRDSRMYMHMHTHASDAAAAASDMLYRCGRGCRGCSQRHRLSVCICILLRQTRGQRHWDYSRGLACWSSSSPLCPSCPASSSSVSQPSYNADCM